MRLSELLGVDVQTDDGRRLGYVADVRLIQDGPLLGGVTAAFRIAGLVVVERRHTRLLGYNRDVGPWIIRATVRALAGEVTYIGWDDLASIDEGRITLRRGHAPTPHRHDATLSPGGG